MSPYMSPTFYKKSDFSLTNSIDKTLFLCLVCTICIGIYLYVSIYSTRGRHISHFILKNAFNLRASVR